MPPWGCEDSKALLERNVGSNRQCTSATDGQSKAWFADCYHVFFLEELKICMSAESECYVPTAGAIQAEQNENLSILVFRRDP